MMGQDELARLEGAGLGVKKTRLLNGAGSSNGSRPMGLVWA